MDCYTRDIDTSSCVHVNLHEIKSTLSYGVHGGPQHAELTILYNSWPGKHLKMNSKLS